MSEYPERFEVPSAAVNRPEENDGWTFVYTGEGVQLVITGPCADPRIIQRADQVIEMNPLKQTSPNLPSLLRRKRNGYFFLMLVAPILFSWHLFYKPNEIRRGLFEDQNPDPKGEKDG